MSEQLEQLGFTCAACGKQFRWKPELAGKAVKCKCGATVTVPAQAGGVARAKAAAAAAAATSSAPATKPGGVTPAQAIRNASSAPGIAGAARAAEVPPRAAAQPAARQTATAATAPPKPAAPSSPPPIPKKKPASPPVAEPDDGNLDGLFELAADAERAAPEAEDASADVLSCPGCRAALPVGTVLCTSCGMDLRTGKKAAAKAARGVAPALALAGAGGNGAAGAADPLPWGVRRRAPQDIGAARGFTTENVYFEGGKFRSLYLPLILIVVGLALSVLNATLLAKQADGLPVTAAIVLTLTLGMIVIDCVLLFITLMLAVRLFDMGFGAVGPALLKIVAIAMGPGAVGGIAGYFAGGGMNGFFVASLVSMILYYALISVLFDLDLGEVLALVSLIYLIENLAKPMILVALFLSTTGGVPGMDKDDADAGSGIGTSGYEVLGDEEEEPPYVPPPDQWDHDGDGVYESTVPPDETPAGSAPTTAPVGAPGPGGIPPASGDQPDYEAEDLEE